MENNNNKPKFGINRIIGKNQLIIVASSEKEIASQLFNYDDIREIRVSVQDLEVKLLMNYDEAYHRVFKYIPRDTSIEEKQKAEQTVLRFYNDLINASMRFTKEELENIKKQQEEQIKRFKEENSSHKEN